MGMPPSTQFPSGISRAEDLRSRVVALASEGDADIGQHAHHVVYVPRTLEALSPILNTVPLQLFAYYVAVGRGCDVDQPRNLAKSVTVE